MNRKISLLLVLLMMVTVFAGCTSTPKEEAVVAKVIALKGPTGMGMVKMIEDEKNSESTNYEFSITGAIDEITPKLVKKEVDIAAVPANLASILYNNTNGEIVTLGINTLGVLYIVENGNKVSTVEDLKGKTIYLSGKGATPEYALNYILEQNGINVSNDVKLEFKAEHTECLAALLNDKEGIALLPEPFVTTALTKSESLRVALDLNSEWENLNKDKKDKSSLITGVIVARKEFVEKYPEKVKEFLEEYKKSVEYTNNDIDEASKLIEVNGIVPAAIATKAIPRCNITLVTGQEMKNKLSGYLEILNEANPKAVGGKLPGEDIYYMGKNK